MPVKILLGTNNPGKIWKYGEILQDLDVEIVTPKSLGFDFEVEENGTTFEENAIAKAKAYSQASGLITLSEDSGLLISALGGKPGVKFRTFDGEVDHRMEDEEWVEYCLKRMYGIEDRKAELVFVAAVKHPDYVPVTVKHKTCFVLTHLPYQGRVIEGFPVRQIMYHPQYRKHHMELTREESDALFRTGFDERIKAAVRKYIFNNLNL